jgi:hypothetical protein
LLALPSAIRPRGLDREFNSTVVAFLKSCARRRNQDGAKRNPGLCLRFLRPSPAWSG